jgi:hypothetical protein
MSGLSIGATIAWQIAVEEAAEAGHSLVEREHVVIGVCSLEKARQPGALAEPLDARQAGRLDREAELIATVLGDCALDPAAIRRSLRERLGVREAAIDEGWTIWMRLRDALAADEVVNLQGDRVMPGQKGQAVRFLHGHLLLPTGPIKLATASGAPLVPVFSIRTPDGRIRIHIEEPIWVDPAAAQVEGVHPALLEFAAILERYVKAYPEQWLLLQPAFVEDTDVRREVRA